jgi:predicted DCC family thiol-disulfide oxidoreductase YuxK
MGLFPGIQMERVMPESPEFPLRVFYDGGCNVCSTEMKASFAKIRRHLPKM